MLHFTIPFFAGISALFQFGFDFSIYRQVFLIADGMLKACPEGVNVCVETAILDEENIEFYKKPYKTDSIYRSILFRKQFYDKLIEIREKTGISFSRLVNGSIKDFIEKYQGKYF